MTTVLALQLIIPLGLVVWLLLWPPHSALGIALLSAAAMITCLGSYLAGVWTAIPRWSLIVVAGVGLIAVARSVRRRPDALLPTTLLGWAIMAIPLILVTAGGWVVTQAWLGRRPPPLPSIALEMPVRGDDVAVASGGSRLLINAHQDTLNLSVPRHRLWQGQSYAVDLVALTPWGRTSRGLRPADPGRYTIFGRSVHAPCDGIVTRLRDARVDLPVPVTDARVMEGNFITLRCRGADVVMAHLKQGSITVSLGQRVQAGAAIAAVGNSGMTDEPHLHIHAQTPGSDLAPFSGKPVIMLFNNRFLARNERI